MFGNLGKRLIQNSLTNTSTRPTLRYFFCKTRKKPPQRRPVMSRLYTKDLNLMNACDLCNDALSIVREIDSSMQISSFEYDGFVNKIRINFTGKRDGTDIKASRYLNIPCNSHKECKAFLKEYPEVLI